jgi:hypothetical protein
MDNHFLLPQNKFDELTNRLLEVQKLVTELCLKPRSMTDWVSEAEAQALLGLKETSLWSLRKRKQIVFSKIGSKTFYSVKSIEKLLNKNQE